MSEQVGTITWINGPVIRAQGSRKINMLDVVEVGEERLIDIRLQIDLALADADATRRRFGFIAEGEARQAPGVGIMRRYHSLAVEHGADCGVEGIGARLRVRATPGVGRSRRSRRGLRRGIGGRLRRLSGFLRIVGFLRGGGGFAFRGIEALLHRLQLSLVIVLQLFEPGLVLALHRLHFLPHIAEIVGFGGKRGEGQRDAARGEAQP